MKAYLKMIAAMLIFGSIGLFVRDIPLASGEIVFCRAVLGGTFLGVVLLLRREKPDRAALRRQLPLLLISGAVMGANWAFLFEAYRYTSVSAATLSYYCAPVLVLLASPIVLKERLTAPKLLGVAAAMTGMVLVGGFGTGGSSDARGILCGLLAAALYGALMLMGKFVEGLSGIETTFVRLIAAALVMGIYAPLTHTGPWVFPTGKALVALLVVGVLHTGIACYLFFSALAELPGQTSALLSYIDPASALMFSALFLGERMTAVQLLGAALILGGAAFGELYHGKKGVSHAACTGKERENNDNLD